MKRKVSFKQFPLLRGIKGGNTINRLLKDSKYVESNSQSYNDLINSAIVEHDLRNIFEHKDLIIDYYTESYEKAVEDSNECILNILCKKVGNDILKTVFDLLNIREDEAKFGISISQAQKTGLKVYTVYSLYYSKEDHKPTFRFYTIEEVIDNKGKFNVIACYFISNNIIANSNTTCSTNYNCASWREDLGEAAVNSAIELLKILTFKVVAKTEIEVIDLVDTTKLPKNISKFNRNNAINNLVGDITINYYSANWYKEILVDHEFSVRGHWRNQPTNDGIKLVFIKPFVKHGYHRKAKKDQAEVIY